MQEIESISNVENTMSEAGMEAGSEAGSEAVSDPRLMSKRTLFLRGCPSGLSEETFSSAPAGTSEPSKSTAEASNLCSRMGAPTPPTLTQ